MGYFSMVIILISNDDQYPVLGKGHPMKFEVVNIALLLICVVLQFSDDCDTKKRVTIIIS